jgi:hypothetical protein
LTQECVVSKSEQLSEQLLRKIKWEKNWEISSYNGNGLHNEAYN